MFVPYSDEKTRKLQALGILAKDSEWQFSADFKVTPELKEWVERFLEEDAEAMKKLAEL